MTNYILTKNCFKTGIFWTELSFSGHRFSIEVLLLAGRGTTVSSLQLRSFALSIKLCIATLRSKIENLLTSFHYTSSTQLNHLPNKMHVPN